MNITVINGTEKHGVTYKIKEILLEALRQNATITEFYMPKDCPAFCSGCTTCFTKSETLCKDYEYIQKIEKALLNADLIVFTSPSYVMHATGALKSLLDHLGYRWMPHRPAKEMFAKRAVILTQCLGAGAKSAAKDIKDSLSWWGISYIKTFTAKLMNNIVWDKLTENKRKSITKGIKRLCKKLCRINYLKPAKTSLVTKIKFNICRMIQKSILASNTDSADGKYWEQNGWLKKARPWKNLKMR